jgi:hypothetical protein
MYVATSETTRQSVRDFEKRFTIVTGNVDLMALFNELRQYPEQMRLYIEVSRDLRAERANSKRSIPRPG